MAHPKPSKVPPVTAGNQSAVDSSGPDVILDFIFDKGLLFISINNIGDKPAYKVSVKFDAKIYGLSGTKEISALPLFRNIEFLAPRKQIVTFLDHSNTYFGGKGPTKISARISFLDSAEHKHVVTINHDLEIYREIGFISRDELVEPLCDLP
ncbi:MAG: hypothetical protein ND895_25320 [Pyrinomonadaceae bacterium]|nr:hypothetical protein [Pyrinomonadaceae bacterium]